jgi:GMP synthase-like glutamine amidotransferase
VKHLMPTLSSLLLALGATTLQAGGACAVAKKHGQSTAIEWVAGPDETAVSAQEKAMNKLLAAGHRHRYSDVHSQEITNLKHAYVVIVRSEFETIRKKKRVSYGCGFHPKSSRDAEWEALKNLQSYSWGWYPNMGYEIVEKFRY